MEANFTFLIWIIIIAFIIFDIFIVVFLLKRKKKLSPELISFVQTRWNTLYKMKDLKHAIMEADKLLDYVLNKFGYKGSLGEKLKKAKNLFPDNNSVWEAHKMRNKIAHELDFKLDNAQARNTLNKFKKTFRDLGINL